jgi:hypothetical protein
MNQIAQLEKPKPISGISKRRISSRKPIFLIVTSTVDLPATHLFAGRVIRYVSRPSALHPRGYVLFEAGGRYDCATRTFEEVPALLFDYPVYMRYLNSFLIIEALKWMEDRDFFAAAELIVDRPIESRIRNWWEHAVPMLLHKVDLQILSALSTLLLSDRYTS